MACREDTGAITESMVSRRGALAGALLLGIVTATTGRRAVAKEPSDEVTPIYFGNG